MARWGIALLFAALGYRLVAGQEVYPAIKKVITMLDNLIASLEEEGTQDEAKFNHFMSWATKELEDTNVLIEKYQAKVEDLGATISGLKTTKMELTAALKKLNDDIGQTQSQINFANNKRNDEKLAFQSEQQEFEAAIGACGKAVKILAEKYGDGSTKEAMAKPDFLGLFEMVKKLGKRGRHYHAVELLQQAVRSGGKNHLRGPDGTVNNDRYQESTGEALGIVDQIKLLRDSFVEDKQSAIEDEARLQKQYDALMKEKMELLNSLTGERDAQQKRLDDTNRQIAETEGELARTERALTDATAHVQQTTKNRDKFQELYTERKKDREEEGAACRQAVDVLAEYRGALIQRASVLVQKKFRGPAVGPKCPSCAKAASLLMARSESFHSTLLQAAAAAAMGSEAIDEIITALDGLIDRLKEEQKSEKEHKEWCEKETGLTTGKRDDHSAIVEDIKSVLANLSEVLVEKKDDLVENGQDINDEDTGFEKMTEVRGEEKEEFEQEHQDHLQAIQALNEAIDILAKFYASRKAAFMQIEDSARARSRARGGVMQPTSGSAAVQLITTVRTEFEQADQHLVKDEDEAVKLYIENKAIHVKEDNDLHSEENQITVEKQSTEEAIDMNANDKLEHEGQVTEAQQYLDQLGQSCYPLLMRYDERKKLRTEEEKSIKDAIKVLKEQA